MPPAPYPLGTVMANSTTSIPSLFDMSSPSPIDKIVTVCVQIGNTDNKLTQQEWSKFHYLIHNMISALKQEMYFSGASHPTEAWQNAAWIFSISEGRNENSLKWNLENTRKQFFQDSVAYTKGETVFI